MDKDSIQRYNDLKEGLSKMVWWAKEKDRRYLTQKKFHEKVFKNVLKQLGIK